MCRVAAYDYRDGDGDGDGKMVQKILREATAVCPQCERPRRLAEKWGIRLSGDANAPMRRHDDESESEEEEEMMVVDANDILTLIL